MYIKLKQRSVYHADGCICTDIIIICIMYKHIYMSIIKNIYIQLTKVYSIRIA